LDAPFHLAISLSTLGKFVSVVYNVNQVHLAIVVKLVTLFAFILAIAVKNTFIAKGAFKMWCLAFAYEVISIFNGFHGAKTAGAFNRLEVSFYGLVLLSVLLPYRFRPLFHELIPFALLNADAIE
jgi:hypothetical protein